MSTKDRPDAKPEQATDQDTCGKDISADDRPPPADGDAIAEVGDAVGGPA